MQYTTNYNLITVEGTDVVNPLVQMNPNFTDIDAAMFANKQASIGTASEIVSGTVHAITRANPDSDYFRFTATGNWTSGDTMSVDGVSVSVFLTDGSTPGTGSYVINSEVFGMIAGSRVTLFLATSPVTSLAATQITFDPTGTALDPSDTDVDSAIRELSAKVSPGSVSVTADGIKTYGQLLAGLYALVDSGKINAKSYLTYLTIANSLYHVAPMSVMTPTEYKFSEASVNQADGAAVTTYIVSATPKYEYGHGAAYSDWSNSIPVVGNVLTIYY